jgi:fumarate reductase subunit C
VHAPIGVANILQETIPQVGMTKPISWLLALLILVLGTTAVIGVYTGGAI